MNGWIKLHRELMNKPIWTTSTAIQKVILITLLSMANHKEREWEWKGEKYKVEPGQFITSLPSIQEKCGKDVSIQNIRTALKRFEKYNFLTCESTNKNRLITIVNWGFYQHEEEKVTDKPTGDPQATGRQLTANKNDKNVKKKDYTSKIKDLLTVYSSKIPDFINLNKQYWDVIRETRTTGKVAESVIYNTMKKWEKYDPVVIQYALKTHIEAHAGKKENYTLGIMRNTPKDEAEDRLNSNVVDIRVHRYKKANEDSKGRDIPDDFKLDMSAGEE